METSNQIRQAFLEFFADRGHVVRPSASLIPIDPTLLLTNAGMVPFKPYFLGEEAPPFDRAVSPQKCVRTIDIDIIGSTDRHISFFEMLGNFSFGDYFKPEAIAWAHEFVTTILGLPEDRLWYTVYETDDEAADIWLTQEGIDPERLQRGGKDNFWQMGVAGPCGPSSEIFYDRGPEFGADGGPIGGGEDRFVEIWNLVFMQNIQDVPYHVVGDLPAKSIDTGMGLERVAMVLQQAGSIFEIDTVRPILEEAAAYGSVSFGDDPTIDVSLKIIADHARTVAMLVGDGVTPSNAGRGYVLRRVLRRAVRHGWQLGGDGLIMPRLIEVVVEVLGGGHRNLVDKRELLLTVVEREETQFRRTLEAGQSLMSEALSNLEPGGVFPGSVAFKLHDTFGFPIEMTKEIAAEAGHAVDEDGFVAEMSAQRARAKAAFTGGAEAALGQMYLSVLDAIGPTTFVGYEVESSTGTVLAMLSDGDQVERVEQGQSVEVFLDATPFYAGSGGQVGDTGTIRTETGVVVVADTKHAVQGFHGHRGKVTSGFVQTGQLAELAIDSPRRERIRKSHTGTHLVHAALRTVIGAQAHQAGSLVEPGRLRFDFNHHAALTDEEILEVERLTNEQIIENPQIQTSVTSMDEAKAQGALAFFGDKYGDTVRMVRIGEFSKELCGGTHTPSAGQVGPIVLTTESSVGSNVRRIEALSGNDGYTYLSRLRRALDSAGSLLRAAPGDVPARVEALLAKNQSLELQLAALADQARSADAAELAARAVAIGEAVIVVTERSDLRPDELRLLAMAVRDRIGSGIVLIGSAFGGKGALVGLVTKDLVDRGVSAAELVSVGAGFLGGGGSRDPELSQAGGPNGSNLGAALEAARESAERTLTEV